jgi:hypothetical protein
MSQDSTNCPYCARNPRPKSELPFLLVIAAILAGAIFGLVLTEHLPHCPDQHHEAGRP